MLAMNISRMVGIRKLDQDGNHVAGATLQILGHDHETVMKEFVTTDEDFFWAPSAYLNDGSSQYYLHEVSAPGGYLISEEDIPFTFELGETIEYLQIEDVNTRIMKTYKPSVVTVNGKTVEDNIIVMTDKATDVTISKTDITGTEEIGGASLAVYRAEDILDGEPIEGKEAIDSWTSEEGKSHRIVGKLGQPLERIITALERIRELNPFPAQGFDTGEALHYVTPDITIVKFPDRFEILLNQYSYPEIRINKYYLKLLRSDCDRETKTYLNAKLRQIEETREHIARRGSTLMALAEFLLEHQQDFFLHGESRLAPLKMKDAASSIGVHESTISRAVRDKYLQCPWGLFPLSYFFSAGVGGEDKEQTSARRIKAEIRDLVDQEDSSKPLSDQKICDLLQEKGIAVSRRTVAKYREEMGIGSTRERKSWK